jgi:hypothetical protein
MLQKQNRRLHRLQKPNRSLVTRCFNRLPPFPHPPKPLSQTDGRTTDGRSEFIYRIDHPHGMVMFGDEM